jgi:threonine synthase
MNEGVSAAASVMVCAGCGAKAPDATQDPYPFRCSRASQDEGVDHLMARALDTASMVFPRGDEPNPFVQFRQLFHSYHVARTHGMADEDYVALVRDLDEAVARVDGRGFRITPFARSAALSRRLGLAEDGGVWVKNETGNVSGSHKARHLMGIMIYLQVLERVGLVRGPLPGLAIASCGNAAVAAAVVARAAERTLQVFIPPDAPPAVIDRLSQLGAHMTVCRRDPGVRGDPCYRRFRDAVGSGALPFCCQGTANGLTIEGGETLGYEIIASPDAPALDRVVIQVGGGALASAVIQSFTEAVALGICTRLPRFHAVQTRGAFPLKRAYDRLARRILEAATRDGVRSNEATADLIARRFPSTLVQRELHYAAAHRSEFMWPWEVEPRSLAHGILDDETYDWLAIVTGMLASGGGPVVVDEPLLVEAHDLARETTGIDVDHTGAAGLAGLLQLRRDGIVPPRDTVALVFSGATRQIR